MHLDEVLAVSRCFALLYVPKAVTPVGATNIGRRHPHMSHILLRATAAPNVKSAPFRVCPAHPGPAGVLVTEKEVVLGTATVLSVSVTTRHHRLATKLIGAISRIHIALPEPRPHYPPRRAYFEVAEMSREMDHL